MTGCRFFALLLLTTASAMPALPPAVGQGVPPPPSENEAQEQPAVPAPPPQAPMPESLRTDIRRAVIVGGHVAAGKDVDGTYKKATPGLEGGMAEGSRLGTISTEVGPVNVNFPVPILTIPGAIYGGLTGASKREIQEFRDALTEELANADSQPLTNYGLALDVHRELARMPSPTTKLFAPGVDIPDDTDAVLYVRFNNTGIDVQGRDAIVTVSATATLQSAADGSNLYEREVWYRDQDTLSNWTKNDNALWRDFSNFAAHYLAREIVAEVFGRIDTPHVLTPTASDSVKADRRDPRLFTSRTRRPTLAWDLGVDADKPVPAWLGSIGAADLSYDVEIYDEHRLVYAEKQVREPRHTLAVELPECSTYRWTVRPVYRIDGATRYGRWLRFSTESEKAATASDGLLGRNASTAPAYIQDFAKLRLRC